MKAKHLISLKDLEVEDIWEIFCLANDVKENPWKYKGAMAGKTLGMIFEKSSTRTRVSFETAMTRMGGHAIFLSPKDTQLGRGESVADTARVLSRYVDVLMARVFKHSDVQTLAEFSAVPVINGLSDFSHPCQGLTDYFTMFEAKGELEGQTLAWVGDANNNCCHSLMFGGALLGVSMNIACPKGYEPKPAVLKWARKQGEKTGAKFEVMVDPNDAVKNADAIYTDVWVSMGQEAEREKRLKIMAPYQVNLKLFNKAKKDAIFLHCLPAHRGEEVTDDVADHDRSYIFDEAENRMHVQAAIMLLLLEANASE